MYFRDFVIISPWKRVGLFIWTNLIPFTKGCIVPNLVELAQWFWRRRFLIFVIVFSLFGNYQYLPLEKRETLHLNTLESSSPKNALWQIWLKLAQWFWSRRFFNFVNVFSLCPNYLLLETGRALHLNKLESPLPKDNLCQVWLKLAWWFWRRSFFLTSSMYFSLFCNYPPLEKGGALHLNKIESPSCKVQDTF